MDTWKALPASGASAKFTSEVQNAYEGALLTRKIDPRACVIFRSGSGTFFFSPGAEALAELFGAVDSPKPDGGDLVLLAGDENAMKRMFPRWPYKPAGSASE